MVGVTIGARPIEVRIGEQTTLAATSAAVAQLAANSAAAAGRYFPSQAAGEAGSTTGQFFSHPDGTGGLVYRERTGGGSTVISYAATKSQVDAKVDIADLAADNGSELVGYRHPAGTSVPRTVYAALRQWPTIRDFGAQSTPDASAPDAIDDEPAVTNAITYCEQNRIGRLEFPAPPAGNVIMLGAKLRPTKSVSLIGPGEHATQLMAKGLSADDYIIDYDCDDADQVSHLEISGLTIRSLDGVPKAMRLKNVSFATIARVRLYNVAQGIMPDGVRCFGHTYDNVVGFDISGSTYFVPPEFRGGGQFAFRTCTLVGDYGAHFSSGSYIDGISFESTCNFEGCDTHGLLAEGSLIGAKFSGPRCEGNVSSDFVFAPVEPDEVISGLSVTGGMFLANASAGVSRIKFGGGGKVEGFEINANTAAHPDDAFAAKLLEFDGAGDGGTVFANMIRGLTADGAGAVSAARAGVLVFGNRNMDGALTNYFGTTPWTTVS